MKNKKGFTMLELIASMAIFIIITVTSISMIRLGLQYNSTNRDTYHADLISKSFLETLQSKNNRPEKQGELLGLADDTYIVYIGDDYTVTDFVEEVNDYTKNNFILNNGLDTTTYDPETDIAQIVSEVRNDLNKKQFTLVIKVQGREGGSMYDLDIWSWDTDKGMSSVVNRKKIINAKV